MERGRRTVIILLAVGLLVGALCLFLVPERSYFPGKETSITLSEEERAELAALLDAQLGLLSGYISPDERAAAAAVLEEIWPLRSARLERDRVEKSENEKKLLQTLNELYERYTVKYMGEAGRWDEGGPTEHVIQSYRIEEDAILPLQDGGSATPEEQREHNALWRGMNALLPEGAFDDFTTFTVFTDGADEVLAYTQRADRKGTRWEIAIDPADTGDTEWFYETVIHEYSHYLTLNSDQVTYTLRRTASTYGEEGMVSKEGSYVDDFYQTFWTDVLDDRLADIDTFNFYRRHAEDFVTGYAATSPAEDIAESIAYFVLYDPPEEDTVWSQKQNFFYQYPELTDFREAVRGNLARLDGE